ncbi:pilus assembly protein TadG-related protein [Agrococcus terreus]|uniref:pilus assembly protein TadG-related protein n=1 Tax=Agrococcus terreus TaxID=574649 RepID=UPI00384CA173
MQRLIRRQRDRDRGAVAVWVALLMVPFLIASALAIDIAAANADRQRLQTGADAAALAIAQDCARRVQCTPDARTATARAMATANDPLVDPADAVVTRFGSGQVQVRTSSERDYLFAPVLGQEQVSIEAEAAAMWGYPTGGPAVMPFAFSWCELAVQAGLPPIRDASNRIIGIDVPEAGVTRTVLAAKKSDSGCTGPSGNVVPGGFGWLEPTEGCGETVTDIDGWAPSDPGNSPPNGCKPQDFSKWVGQTVFLPVFETATGQGNNAQYGIFGYVAFRLEAYYFAGQYVTPDRPCSGSERCMRGTFLRFADLDTDFEYSADGPQLGATVVQLLLPEEN